MAWSYDLLTDAEREVFVRLAVFPADFSLEAAEMVVSDAVVEEGDVLDLLTRLVEKSLVTTVISTGHLPVPAARDASGVRARPTR